MYKDWDLDDFLNVEATSMSLYFMYDRLNELVFNNKLPKCKVVWNKRTSKVAGSAWCEDRKIEISYKYHSKYPEELLNTMVHEMTHILYPNDDHSEVWKKGIKKLNDEFPILELQQYSKLRYWKYVYGCDCGKEWKRSSKFRNNKYHCVACKSYLKLKSTCNHA